MKQICVPTSMEAMQRLDLNQSHSGDLVELNLSSEEFKEIWATGIFKLLNNSLNKLIDEHEDAVIYFEELQYAESIVREVLENNQNDLLLNKLLDLVKSATIYQTGIFFFF